jgi:mono/diheme cytochrome c family protein
VDLFSMAACAHDHDIPFPVLQDFEHRLADLLEITTVPEVVVLDVLDGGFEKRYQGAIDDQFKKRGRIPEANQHYLVDAVNQVLKGERVAESYVPPSGCPVERRGPARIRQGLTYHKDVAPLMQKHCQSCHRGGGVGPFELLSYEDVTANVEKIKEVVSERRMPPWHGLLNPQFGKLLNDKRLSREEIRTILDWIEAGAPPGIVQDAPAPVKWPGPDAWAIGKPDFVYKLDEPFKVPKSGILDYQFFRAKLNYPEDRWFRAIEVRAGNPEVVHHIVLHIVPADDREYTGFMGMALLYGVNAQRGRMIGDYIPGDTYNAKVYPSDQAVCIPKNMDLIYEIHYTPNNREETTDQSMVAFQWASEPPEEEVFATVFRKPIGRFKIPAHNPHYKIEDTYYFPHDIELDAVRPHFHLRGKSFRLEMIERNDETDEIEKRTTIVSVPIYDPAWQRSYELESPLRIPAGTELLATGHFDNSSLNPNNPNPTIDVEWGQQTSDEMFSTRFKYRLAK